MPLQGTLRMKYLLCLSLTSQTRELSLVLTVKPTSNNSFQRGRDTICFTVDIVPLEMSLLSFQLLQISTSRLDLTSSGSMSLNSMPRPVQAMKGAFPGSSSRATRNCQSCRDPRRWQGAPSRNTLPPSCFTSPGEEQGHRRVDQAVGSGWFKEIGSYH